MGLELKQLVKTYGSFTAVDGLDLSLKKGRILGLLGPNGSGKTTTVRMIAGLLKPTRGDVVIDGCSIRDNRLEAKSRLGILPDNGSLFPHLSLEEHLLMEARVRRVPSGETRAQELLAYCDLWGRRHTLAGQASVGMRKKLGIAMALIHLPPVVVLDEPFEGLDPVSARRICALLLEMVAVRKTTLLITSHMLALMEDLVDQGAMIKEGRLVGHVALADLRKEGKPLEAVYLEAFEQKARGETEFSWLR